MQDKNCRNDKEPRQGMPGVVTASQRRRNKIRSPTKKATIAEE